MAPRSPSRDLVTPRHAESEDGNPENDAALQLWHASASSVVVKRQGFVDKVVVGLQATASLEQSSYFSTKCATDPPPPCLVLPLQVAAQPGGTMLLCRMPDAGVPLELVQQLLPYLRTPSAAAEGPRELLRWWRLRHLSRRRMQLAVRYTQRKVLLLVEMLQQLVPGLQWLDRMGLSHHDLKLANIGYDPARRQFVLWDFGLASQRGREPLGCTPYYASPEYLLAFNLLHLQGRGCAFFTPGEVQELRTMLVASSNPGYDIFSLGVILYQLTTGAAPYPGIDWSCTDWSDLDSRQLLGTHHLGWQLAPPAWQSLLLDMLQPNPHKRLDRWESLPARLQEVLTHIHTTCTNTNTSSRTSSSCIRCCDGDIIEPSTHNGTPGQCTHSGSKGDTGAASPTATTASSSSSSSGKKPGGGGTAPLTPFWPGVDVLPRGALWRLPSTPRTTCLHQLQQHHLQLQQQRRSSCLRTYEQRQQQALFRGQLEVARVWTGMAALADCSTAAEWDAQCADLGLVLPDTHPGCTAGAFPAAAVPGTRGLIWSSSSSSWALAVAGTSSGGDGGGLSSGRLAPPALLPPPSAAADAEDEGSSLQAGGMEMLEGAQQEEEGEGEEGDFTGPRHVGHKRRRQQSPPSNPRTSWCMCLGSC